MPTHNAWIHTRAELRHPSGGEAIVELVRTPDGYLRWTWRVFDPTHREIDRGAAASEAEARTAARTAILEHAQTPGSGLKAPCAVCQGLASKRCKACRGTGYV